MVATLVLGLLGFTADLAQAQHAEWADALFTEHAHDFGPVPRGAKVRHSFVLTNRLDETVNILDIQASCGCTSGRISTSAVAPGQTAVIEAQMDTRNFVGVKSTTLTVSLVTASGRQASVKFGIQSNILSDIVLNPGSIDFGTVAKGQAPKQMLTIERVSSQSWRATRVVANPNLVKHITAALTETSRSDDGVIYTLTVSLRPNAPAGGLREEIRIFTNDPETPMVPVLVTATIQGTLTAKPSSLDLGKVTSAGGAQGRYLLSAKIPFTVKSVEGNTDGFTLSANDGSAKTLQILTVSYRPAAGSTRGDLRHRFRVRTDLPDEPPVDLIATLHVDP
jgi:hypothetical protein